MPIRPNETCENDPPPQASGQQDSEGVDKDGMEQDEDNGNSDSDATDMYSPDEVEEQLKELVVNKDENTERAKSYDGEKDDKPLLCGECGGNSRVPMMLRSPMRPSAEDIEKHDATHLPYRTWCPPCVKAKAKEDAHPRKSGDGEEAGVPIISMDYNHVDAEKAEDEMKMLIVKHEPSGSVLAYKVLTKGTGDTWVIKALAKDIEEFGQRDIILKTDGEPSIVALQTAIQSARDGRTIPRNPPAYNPQSNGACEKAVQDVTAHLRTLKIALEARLGVTLPQSSKVMEWAIRHAAFLITRYSVGHDGMAGWERLNGRKWNRCIVEFAEVVLGKLATRRVGKGRSKRQKNKLAERSVRGVWVGQATRTGEHIIVKESGDAVRCRTITRVPIEDRWNADLVLGIQGVPRRPAPSIQNPESVPNRLVDDEAKDTASRRRRQPRRERPLLVDDEIPKESGVGLPPAQARAPREIDIRRFRITDQILEKYGMSDNCPGCEYKAAGRNHRAHSEHCRKRIFDRIIEDDVNDTFKKEEERRVKLKEAMKLKGKDGTEENEPNPDSAHVSVPDMDDGFFDDKTFPEGDVEMATLDEEGIPELKETDVENTETQEATMQDIEENDDLFGDDDEPAGKKQKLAALFKRPQNSTCVGRTMADEVSEIDNLNRINECLAQMTKIKERVDVKQILEDLEKGSRLKLPKAKRQQHSMQATGKFDVTEIYSPPRITAMAKKMGLKDGWALDLTETDEDDNQPWDFSIPSKRKKAKDKVKADKPLVLVLCPMCGPFSTVQEFNYQSLGEEKVTTKLGKALEHVKFCLELCMEQHAAGRLFVFEHPVGASSWSTEMMRQVASMNGVMKVNFDFCTLGMKAKNEHGDEKPAKKRTTIMTNSAAIATLLKEAQCGGRHEHVHLLDGKAGPCQAYPEPFCRMICEGIKRELDTIKWRNKLCKVFDVSTPFGKLMALQKKMDDVVIPPEENDFAHLYDDAKFVDDVTGSPLDKSEAIKARRTEIKVFKEMGVYTKVRREPWMRVISTKWLDINKGDEIEKNYRARLVGREIKRDQRSDLFAATPPLESLRMILSICASNQYHEQAYDRYIVMTNDVRRAYFYAPATRPVYIEIPAEDFEDGDEMMAGRLNLSLYGTRDAALNWSVKYTKVLEELGFVKGKCSPCNFHHEKRGIAMTVHGDDFTSTGREADMRWLQAEMAKNFEIKTNLLGPDPKRHVQEVRILNRVVTWGEEGICYEADQRHGEILVRELGLEHSKPVSTPGTREDANKAGYIDTGIDVKTLLDAKKTPEDDEPLTTAEATQYRALAARANYLAQDRPDAQYAVKEVARRMANPRRGDWNLLKRLGRYFKGAPRAVYHYYWQSPPAGLDTSVDSDWAGCKSSGRSTSGGVVQHGWHVIKTWSTTQAVVAMSSAEAELYAMTKGAAHTLGIMSLGGDFGMTLNAKIHADANAALGIVNRQGLGKLRHIRVQYLWLQSRVKEGDIVMRKIPGKANPADLMTKHLPANEMERHLDTLNVELRADRAGTAPQLNVIHHEGSDHWAEGNKGTVVRCHRRARRELFTPLRVQGSPPGKALAAVRITEGAFLDGSHFRRCDNWTARSTSHLRMPRPWTGTTTFMTKTAGLEVREVDGCDGAQDPQAQSRS